MTASHTPGDVKVWSVSSGDLIMTVSSVGTAPDVSPVHLKSAKFSDYGKVLLLAVDDGAGGMVSSLNLESGESIDDFSPGAEDLSERYMSLDSAAFSQCGALVALTARDGGVEIWNAMITRV
jgi:WD40 repeat protein